jgi:hypothetical protein
MRTLAAPRRPADVAAAAAVSPWFHLLAGAWVLAMFRLATSDSQQYRMLLQEDRIIEWGTVWLFLVAGVLGLRTSFPARRAGDVLVALFCLFVAGEEFSWGQRLLGYFPPEFFLRNNVQQEFSVHNLPQSIQPGSVLIAALGGHGVLLPVLPYLGRMRALFDRVGVTPPPVALIPWYAAAVLLLWWYPFTLTGEWVELLAGALFLMSTRPAPVTLWPAIALVVVFGASMTSIAGALERGRDEARLTCAAAEVRTLADALVAGDAATDAVWKMRRIHKRLWSSMNEGYIDARQLRAFEDVACGDHADAGTLARRRYGIDPWGTPYWWLVERDTDSEWRFTVYSFGPNRRRDIPTQGEPDPDVDVIERAEPSAQDDVFARRLATR